MIIEVMRWEAKKKEIQHFRNVSHLKLTVWLTFHQ